jgi:L,D-transpeptidase ErfK/SrfK
MIRFVKNITLVIVVLVVLKFCFYTEATLQTSNIPDRYKSKSITSTDFRIILEDSIKVDKSVIIKDYFKYLDSIVQKYDTLVSYKLTEHLLVRANTWIIDTLQNTDYYQMMKRDSFVYDQKKMIALPKGNIIRIPDSTEAKQLFRAFQNTLIDVNIPEYKLRIYQDSVQLYEFPIRVGKYQNKYLEMSGRIQDLRTKTGEGTIVSHVRNPRYVNPVNNHEYKVTRRDDDKVTKLPQIPFLETEIDGLRHGQLIHPTTNPISLGKAYSNGCIGTKEADAWLIYYHAPIGTKIKIRYDLKVLTTVGDSIELEDIYNKRN